jgi:tetratricopeptide (TPR) repeat protein
MGETFTVQERTLCETCTNEFTQSHVELVTEVERQRDPTICANCGADNGETAHEELLQSPVCPKCTAFYRNRPYPMWVNISFFGVLVLVVFSFVWNWRFLQGHFEINAAFAAMAQGQVDKAVAEMDSAAANVPESAEVQELANFLTGLECLNENNYEKAEACFAKCLQLPEEYGAPDLHMHAAISNAFDHKDYSRFLKLANEYAKKHPKDATAQAQVASALACLYATQGDEKLRRQAEDKLQEAKKLDEAAIIEARYEERIRHRLDTREIISREEYLKRFPEAQPSSKETKP